MGARFLCNIEFVCRFEIQCQQYKLNVNNKNDEKKYGQALRLTITKAAGNIAIKGNNIKCCAILHPRKFIIHVPLFFQKILGISFLNSFWFLDTSTN